MLTNRLYQPQASDLEMLQGRARYQASLPDRHGSKALISRFQARVTFPYVFPSFPLSFFQLLCVFLEMDVGPRLPHCLTGFRTVTHCGKQICSVDRASPFTSVYNVYVSMIFLSDRIADTRSWTL